MKGFAMIGAAFALWVGNQELDETLSAPFAWQEISSWSAYEPCRRAAERLNLERKADDPRWYVCEPSAISETTR